jgi:Cytochrome c7 and related cytochrome c
MHLLARWFGIIGGLFRTVAVDAIVAVGVWLFSRLRVPAWPKRTKTVDEPEPYRFRRRDDVLLRLSLAGGAVMALFAGGFLMVRVNAADIDHDAPVQPMWFDHRHHVTGYRIDCRYCHATVERAAVASVPPTETCVPCHQPVWRESRYFAPVRASLATGRPIPWVRVHDLPDYVFFHHAIHVRKGIGCETCHGRVDRMERVKQVAPLTMEWCLDCHREPERYLRPPSAITTMGYRPDRPQEEVGLELKRAYGIEEVTTCTACHR